MNSIHGFDIYNDGYNYPVDTGRKLKVYKMYSQCTSCVYSSTRNPFLQKFNAWTLGLNHGFFPENSLYFSKTATFQNATA